MLKRINWFKLDFTEKNKELTDTIVNDIELFIQYIKASLLRENARYGIGGYNENRTIYRQVNCLTMRNPELSLGY